jgi:hypothetical protein
LRQDGDIKSVKFRASEWELQRKSCLRAAEATTFAAFRTVPALIRGKGSQIRQKLVRSAYCCLQRKGLKR